jgi:hypothetical protein
VSVRQGMTNLITQVAALVNDTSYSSFTQQRIQEILDSYRFDFYQEPLAVTAQQIAAGTVSYHVYNSQYKRLEGTASGTTAFRLYDSTGSAITSGYTLDANNGIVRFNATQAGSARYLDARSFDLYGAVAAGWRERASQLTDAYDFRVEGRQYSRSQWFKHCMDMAKQYEAMRSNVAGGWGAVTSYGVIERGDMC